MFTKKFRFFNNIVALEKAYVSTTKDKEANVRILFIIKFYNCNF